LAQKEAEYQTQLNQFEAKKNDVQKKLNSSER
jgi:hypothetical protein